ncbi:MAG: response regulator, partial [Myxococcales bacterium]|nr:response regulator [Myxococcales bacterium]
MDEVEATPPAILPRVAIVDDEPRMAEVLAMILRSSRGDAPPLEVRTFTSPQAFLDALDAGPFDVLLSDLKMPRIGGVELTRRARARCPELAVVLITAHATIETAVAALKEGALDYL